MRQLYVLTDLLALEIVFSAALGKTCETHKSTLLRAWHSAGVNLRKDTILSVGGNSDSRLSNGRDQEVARIQNVRGAMNCATTNASPLKIRVIVIR